MYIFDAVLGLAGIQEVDVGAFRVERVDGVPAGTASGPERSGVLGVGTDASDPHGPSRVARDPGRGVLGDPPDGAIDRVQMHQAECGRCFGRVGDMHVDSLVGQRLDEVAFPAPPELALCREALYDTR